MVREFGQTSPQTLNSFSTNYTTQELPIVQSEADSKEGEERRGVKVREERAGEGGEETVSE